MNRRQEAIDRLKGLKGNHYTEQEEAIDIAINALQRQERIEEIINISNMIIQEDVLKYKMICEVMNK